MRKIFKVSQIRDLLNQVYNEKITFSRFVEILNELPDEKKQVDVQKFENEGWFKWLIESEHNGLNESSSSDAIRDISNKINELIDKCRAL